MADWGWQPTSEVGPLARAGLRQRAIPFLALYVASMSVAILTTSGPPTLATVGVMLAWTAAAAAAGFLLPWFRWPPSAQVVLPVLTAASIGGLVVAHVSATGISLIMLLPVAWVAIYGSRADVAIVMFACCAALFLPAWLFPDAAGGDTLDGLRRAVLFLIVAGGLSWVLQTARTSTFTDPLTGTFNRRAWDLTLSHELERAGRTSEPVCVAALDLDLFKVLNDRHGHAAGDAHLQDCARVWKGELRAYDTLARLGGDEFGVVLSGTHLDEAGRLMERVAVSTPSGETASVGVVQWDGRESAADLLARADRALYAAKQGVRARTTVVR